ncbi:MAG: type IV secretion system DNA-binding domain-containing protein [bacterium]|nr:type IV secretion system DNA-binding domain-containing protein [bacterium]
MENNEVTMFAQTNFRNQRVKFGIKTDDRRRHMYVIGKTGVGKTEMLENMALADIKAGRGIGIIDPHGEFAEKILELIPESRMDDVIYFNPADINFPMAFNPLELTDPELRHLVASGIMSVFKKIWPDVWSARMEYILNNSLLTLLEYPGSTLLGIMHLLADKEYRRKVVENLQDPVIKSFWVDEFARYTQRLETEAVAAIQNKVGQFIANPLIRNIIGQPHSTFDIRKIMDEGKIFIANLSKGRIGEDNSRLLGALMITKIQLAAMSRSDIAENKRRDFYLYVDEFQNFATESFANILSEARKYRLDLILAHQYIGQLVGSDKSTKVRDAVFGNVGTIVVFRVGAEDAEFLEKEFEPEFLINDLVNLPKFNIYTKLMIDGIASRAFSAETLPLEKAPADNLRDVIIENCRHRYSLPKEIIEQKIADQMNKKESIEQKIVRRDEMPLEKVLGPRQPAETQKPQRPASQFSQPATNQERPVRERAEVNIGDLQKAIEEALKDKEEKHE